MINDTYKNIFNIYVQSVPDLHFWVFEALKMHFKFTINQFLNFG